MSQLAVGVAGGAIGSLIPGVGTAIGWAIGSALGGLIFRAKGPQVEGPRLEDLTVQTSVYGQPIPRYWGTYRAAGNLIWTDGITETSHEEKQGGKGGPSATYTTYTYSASFAVAFGAGPIAAIRRLWADGKLLYDVSDDADIETVMATQAAAEAFRFYAGSESQERDPLIEAIEGADATPAYRGLAYVVFEGLQLGDFGNRVPNITAEILAAGEYALNKIGEVDYADTLVFTAQVAPQTLCPVTPDGMVHITMNEWDANYLDKTVSYWRIHPDGSAERRHRFESDYSGVPTAGHSDEPAWATYDPPNNLLHLYLIAPDFIQWTGHIQLPTFLPTSLFNKLHIRDRVAYFLEHDSGQPVYLFRFYLPSIPQGFSNPLEPPPEYEGSPEVEHIFDWSLSHPDGPLYNICPGDDVIYGLTTDDKLITWDLDFNQLSIETLSFPTALNYDQGRDTCVILRGNRDGDLLFISNGWVHRWEDGSLDSRTIAEASDLYPSQYNGSWGAAGNQLVSQHMDPGWSYYDVRRYRLEAVTPTGQTLDTVTGELLAEAGLDPGDTDLTDLSSLTVDGFSRTHPMTVRSACEALQRTYHFDLLESDWLIKARRRGDTSPDMTAAEDDLGCDGAERLPHARVEELELPRRVTLDYRCAARDYQVNHQYASRTQTQARAVEQLHAPLVLADDQARQVAETLLAYTWTARDSYAPKLPPRFIVLDPGDLLEITRDDASVYFLRVIDIAYVPGGSVALKTVAEQAALYTQVAPGAAAAIPPKSIPWSGPTEVLLLDLPALRDADDDAGFYLAARGFTQGWHGAQVFDSPDGAAYSARRFVGVAARTGYADGVLPAGPTTVWDLAHSLTVETTATLASVTEAAVLDGDNHLAIGAHGRWEIVGYRYATDNGDGTWTLDTLLRGRRGTEHTIAGHADRDRVIFLDATRLRRFAMELSHRGTTRYYKPVTLGATIDGTLALPFAGAAEALKPFSPVAIAGARDGSDNLTLTWTRRTRIGGEWLDYADVPLNEESESYEVDILDTGTVVRTITGLSSPSASYTAAQQITDFGGTMSDVDVEVYQISAAVGRGHAGVATI